MWVGRLVGVCTYDCMHVFVHVCADVCMYVFMCIRR